MNFDRYCGMASAASLMLIFAITMWIGLWGPLWQDVKGGDILTICVAIIGWIVTIGIGWRAFTLSQHQIGLSRDALILQQHQIEMQQKQIDEARQEQRKANFATLQREFEQFAESLDRLKLAMAYLEVVGDRFPDTGAMDGWSLALFFARKDAIYTASETAVAAPFGYGPRILTILNRLSGLGDRMTEGSPNSMPTRGVLDYFEQRVKAAVEGIRITARQIREEMPKREAQMLALADERDVYASRHSTVD